MKDVTEALKDFVNVFEELSMSLCDDGWRRRAVLWNFPLDEDYMRLWPDRIGVRALLEQALAESPL